MSKNIKKDHRKSYVTAKLVFFDWGWADNIIYKLRGKTTEKNKGLMMIQKIKEFFSINGKEIKEHEEKENKKEVNRIKWTRDEEGNIISPFDRNIRK